MSQKSGITSLVGPHYPERTPFGTVARPTPPVIAVLKEDGTVVAEPVDPPTNSVVERLIATIKRKEAESTAQDQSKSGESPPFDDTKDPTW